MRIFKKTSFSTLVLALFLSLLSFPGFAVSRHAVRNTNNVTGTAIVEEARKWFGTYSYYSGGVSFEESLYLRSGFTYAGYPTTFDCSGFVCRVLNDVGLRGTDYAPGYGECVLKSTYGSYFIASSIYDPSQPNASIIYYGEDITSSVEKAKNGDYSDLRPGDVIAWSNGYGNHIIIYSGNGNMIECRGNGDGTCTVLERALSYHERFQWGARLVSDSNSSGNGANSSSLLLNINWDHIRHVGHQASGSQACTCYAYAYCRTILDGSVHYYSEFNAGTNEYDAWAPWTSGTYTGFFPTEKQEAFEKLYSELQSGKPVTVKVAGTRSGHHYVAVVGFENVTSAFSLSASNFLIIDPCAAEFKTENMAAVGYDLLMESGYYQVTYDTTGQTVGSVASTPSSESSSYNPEGHVDEITGGNGTVHIRGWTFDRDDLSRSLELHVYIGGPAGSGEGHAGIIANQESSDVNNAFPGSGTNHRFDSVISTSKTGTQDVYIYALNMVGGGENTLIGHGTATIFHEDPKMWCENINLPEEITQGSSLNLSGTINSNNSVKWYALLIYDSSNQVVQNVDEAVWEIMDTGTYNIDNLAKALDFSALLVGNYRFVVESMDNNNNYFGAFEKWFTVKKSSSSESVHFDKSTIYFQGQFYDIPENQWYSGYVAEAFELGLMKGVSDSAFDPYGNVTIAQAITMAARIHSIYTNGKDTIRAVAAGESWYQPYLDYALENGIIRIAYYNCDVMQKANRAQFAEIFANALPETALFAMNKVNDNAIPDVKITDSYAPYVYCLYRAGILIGSDANGTFYPLTFITRAEAATIVLRMAESDHRVSIGLI